MSTISLREWSFDVSPYGVFINGTVDDDQAYEFHTGPLKAVKDSHTVEDKEGNVYELDGGPVVDACTENGFSKQLCAEFANGFPEDGLKLLRAEKRVILYKRRLCDVNWRDLTPIGIELFALEQMKGSAFEFPNLRDALISGPLAGRSYPLYMFMGSQPCLDPPTSIVYQVPYIVVIDCAAPPPNKIAYHSLQHAATKIINMNECASFARFEWQPYIPHDMLNSKRPRGALPPVYTLQWRARRALVDRLSEADQHYVEYLHPYILLPQKVDDEPRPVTMVEFTWEWKDTTYNLTFDKEIDRLASFVPDFLEDNSLEGEDASDSLEQAIRQAFKDKRAREAEKHEALLDQVDALGPENREALKNIRLFKFYPSHPQLDVTPFAVPTINQYFGDATDVVVAPQVVTEPEPEPEAAAVVKGRGGRRKGKAAKKRKPTSSKRRRK